MRKGILTTGLFSLGMILHSCLDSYTSPETTQDVHYLIVDGFLNVSDASLTVTLSRTLPLTGPSVIPMEKGAQVQLADENGAVLGLLSEKTPGVYILDFSLNPSLIDLTKNYRIDIETSAHSKYSSDFVPVLQTPPIDSISWKTNSTGVSVYANTHDPANTTHYYRWKYTETWAFHSAYRSFLDFKNGKVVPRQENIYDCWMTSSSTNTLVSSSDKLSEDIISEFLLTSMDWNSIRIEEKYSILVEQHAINQEAFTYEQQLKNNSENLGTLFDALPSSVRGNIHCTTNPSEIALGYFTAGTVDKKRIFITRGRSQSPQRNPCPDWI